MASPALRCTAALVLTTATVAALGCTTPPPEPTAPPPAVTLPPATPATENDIIAQRAATYFWMYGWIASNPIESPSQMATVTRGPVLNAYLEELDRIRREGERVTGPQPRIYNTHVGVKEKSEDGRPRVKVTLCLDVQGVDHLNKSGESIKRSEWQSKFSKEVTLEEWSDGWFVTDEAEGKHPC